MDSTVCTRVPGRKAYLLLSFTESELMKAIERSWAAVKIKSVRRKRSLRTTQAFVIFNFIQG